MTIIAILIIALYTILIGVLIIGFFKVKEFNYHSEIASNSFSIIIPFRNEADNLACLLKSISKLNYPIEKFEILLINDNSRDGFRLILNTFIEEHSHLNIKIIENNRKSSSPKKDAIETGIQHSKFEWILTTDADCIVPIFWLRTYNAFILKNEPYFIAGPVAFSKPVSFLDHFQQLDLSALIGSTIGGFGIKKPFMCSGANLCYRKDIFIQLNGFVGNNHLASGDDVFLLEKTHEHFPNKVSYLKSYDALVYTSTEKSISKLIQQRIRWASKATSYSSHYSKLVSFIVFLSNLIFAYCLLFLFFSKNFSPFYFALVISKIIVDFIIIWIALSLGKNEKSILWHPIIVLLHPLFIVSIAIFAIFSSKYNWKNRTFSSK